MAIPVLSCNGRVDANEEMLMEKDRKTPEGEKEGAGRRRRRRRRTKR